MSKSSPHSSARQRLLDAAAQIISTQGVQALTLEGVAAAAGVTKGGLIYHFKTRDDLLGAVVQAMLDQLEQRSRTKAAKAGGTTGSFLSALIDDAFDTPANEKQLMSSLLAAVFSHPHLLEPVHKSFDFAYADLAKSGPRAGLAMAIAVATDGLLLLELLDLHRFNDRQRKAVRQALQTLAKELL